MNTHEVACGVELVNTSATRQRGRLKRKVLALLPAALVSLMLGFTVPAHGADYFVNDTNRVGDVWCSAIGSVTNTGTSTNAPALSVAQVLDAYDIEPGDTIYTDTGYYVLSANVTITSDDGGSAIGGPVTIRGAGLDKTMFTRGTRAGGAYGFHLNGASHVVIRDLHCSLADQAVRFENSTHGEVRDCEIDLCNIGVVLTGGSDHTVSGCRVHHNLNQGILGSSSAGPQLRNNTIHHQSGGSVGSRHGVELRYNCNAAQITGNTIYSNSDRGSFLYSCATPTLSDNALTANTAEGLRLESCGSAQVSRNVIARNGNGLLAYNSSPLTLTSCQLFSNNGYGVRLDNSQATVRNNLIYANATLGIDTLNAGASILENNTLYANRTIGLKLWGNYAAARIANNSVVATNTTQMCLQFQDLGGTWTSDYNNWQALGGAPLWDWKGPRYTLTSLQHYTSRERHSTDLNPRFVDPDGTDNIMGGVGADDDNFHLSTNSPCIDAGDPLSDYAQEPVPNGGRVNIGYYGGSNQADTSPAQRAILLVGPNGSESLLRRSPVRWSVSGDWQPTNTVKIEYSANHGGVWSTAPAAAALNPHNGIYDWNLAGLSAGSDYLVRITDTAAPGISDESEASFTVLNSGPRTFYVNDGSTVDDQWCTGAGSITNDGLTSSTPLDSLQSVIERYPSLGAGDEVRIDTGESDSGRTIYLNHMNSGSSGSNLVLKGSSTGTTRFSRGNTGEDVFFLQNVNYLRLERLTVTGGANGIRMDGNSADYTKDFQVVKCEVYGNAGRGITATYCTNALVNDNRARGNSGVGIYLGSLSEGTVTQNESVQNAGHGMEVNGSGLVADNVCASNTGWWGMAIGGTFVVSGNEVFRNTGHGMGVWAGSGSASRVQANASYENSYSGMLAYGNTDAVSNRVYRNTQLGLRLESGANARRNSIHNNGRNGIEGSFAGTVANNLVFSNAEWNVYADRSGTIENNTLLGGNGLYFSGQEAQTARNNIIWSKGKGKTALYASSTSSGLSSDYNDLFATEGAAVGYWQGTRSTLSAWQQVSFKDAHSISIDPRFVEGPAGFHLRSTAGSYAGEPFTAPAGGSFVNDTALSFCVDAGDPASPYTNESPDNGGRVNIGAFGNTADASRSPGVRVTLLVDPNGDETWFGTRAVTWLTRGPWLAGDTVRLEASDNGGLSWAEITNGLDYAAGVFNWDTSSTTPGTNVLLRVSKSDGSAADASDAAFEISASGPRTYFVNDHSTDDDLYCTAAGTNTSDGLSPATPMDSVQAIVDTYNLGGGDTVKIDTGVYPLSATIIITTNDMGALGNPLVFVGSTHASGTLIDRRDTGNYGLHLNQAGYIHLQHLKVRGASHGIFVEAPQARPVRGVTVSQCESFQNAAEGFHAWYVNDFLLDDCRACSNATGVSVGGTNILVRNNRIYRNTGWEGLYMDGYGEVVGNDIFANQTRGAKLLGRTVARGNTVHDQVSDGGIQTVGSYYSWTPYDAVLIDGNRVYGNKNYGISLGAAAAEARANVVYSNRGNGIFGGGNGETMRNNLIYSNANWNVYVDGTGCATLFENNTLYGGDGLSLGYCCYGAKWFTNRNNVFWSRGEGKTAIQVRNWPDAGFISDNNNYYVSEGAVVGRWMGAQATLADWQHAVQRDSHSLSVDPQFVDMAGMDGVIGGTNAWDDNFHLSSSAGSYTGIAFTATTPSEFVTNAMTSFCVDAGLSTMAVGDELAPNGNRINLGAFGGTPDASLSPEAKEVRWVSVTGGEALRGLPRLTWVCSGPWDVDTVRLEYSANGGTDWLGMPGAEALAWTNGVHDWDTTGLSPGSDYLIRIGGNAGSRVATSGVIRVLANAPTQFFVNDTNTVDDLYCTAAGSDALDGLSPATPKATVKNVLLSYRLIPGDVVRVDTGTYLPDSTIQILDSGSAAAAIHFAGSTNGAGSVFDGGGLGNAVFQLKGPEYIVMENLKVRGATSGIVVEGPQASPLKGVAILGCELSANSASGVSGWYVDGLRVENCSFHGNYNGVSVGGTNMLIRNNQFFENIGAGWESLYMDGYGEITGNSFLRNASTRAARLRGSVYIHDNTFFQNNQGIWAQDSSAWMGIGTLLIENNLVSSNASFGLSLEGMKTLAKGNRVCQNGSDGIRSDRSSVMQNVIYGNKDNGILVDGYESSYYEIANNLVYNNGDTASEFNIHLTANYWQGKRARVENNTVYGGNGIHIGNPIAVTNRNNIIWATGVNRVALTRYTHIDRYAWGVLTSDHNDIYATGGATIGHWQGAQPGLADWRYATGQDAQSFSADPLFVNAAGPDGVMGGAHGLDDNFHLSGTAGSYTGLAFTAAGAGFFANPTNSPCVDAGDPAMGVGDEAAPNGGRINLGAFGGTADATLSSGARLAELLTMTGGETLRGMRRINWRTMGPWQTNHTVALQYSPDAGAHWFDIPGADAVPFAQGYFDWDTGALTPGADYAIRIGQTGQASTDTSGTLVVITNVPITFYVNDANPSNDVYCTALGSDGNTGLTNSAPKATLKNLLQSYTLIPDDVVKVDTGSWTLESNFEFVGAGASGRPIRFVGSPHAAGSIFNRNDTASDAFHFRPINDYIRLEGLRVTGARHGIFFEGAASDLCYGIEIVDCEVYANSIWGIVAVNCSNIVINACASHDNGHGIDVDGDSSGLVSSNSVHHNSNWGLYLNGRMLAEGNDCDNNNIGLKGQTAVRAVNNRVHANRGDGALTLYGVGCEAVGNRVYQNNGDGMNVNIGGSVRRNVVYSNGGHGMFVDSWNGANTVVNNLLYDNDRSGEGHWNIYVHRNGDTIQNNTLVGGNGLYWAGPWGDVTANNVIWAKGNGRYAIYYVNNSAKPNNSDYNDFHATDGAQLGYWGGARATLGDWQAVTGLDSNSISALPLFVDMDGADDTLGGANGDDDDFHLSSTAASYHGGAWTADETNSPCIDAGSPWSDYTNEPSFNGELVNQGAYGNTEQGSPSDYGGPFYTIGLTPSPGYGGSLVKWPDLAQYPANRPVRLTAVTNLNFQFAGWTGDVVNASSPAYFAVTQNTSATGVFAVVSGREGAVFGNLRFQVADSSVAEDAGSATVWVMRTNGLTDSVSVDYATSNNTATAGSDYTLATGTLSFGFGVASNSFSVPIAEDAIYEHEETLNLSLFNPQGGARLGSVIHAVLRIVEDDVPDPLLITTAALLTGQMGEAYIAALMATGGVPPYVWSLPPEVLGTNSFGLVGAGIGLQSDEGTLPIAIPFDFPFYGGSYTQCWVDTNGKIRFDSSARDYTETIADLANAVMIAVLWDDLDTRGASNDVYVQSSPQEVTIRWAGKYYSGSAPVNFSLTLQEDGVIHMKYGDGNATGGMIGISDGTGTNYLLSSRNQSGSMDNAPDGTMYPAGMPAGLMLSTDGRISGTPQTASSNDLQFRVVDTWGASSLRTLSLVIVDPARVDSDNDDIPDDWEMARFGSLTNVNARSDWDQDLFIDLYEYWAGTDPTNRFSNLCMMSPGFAPGGSGFVVRWSSVAGKFYSLQRSTNLLYGFSYTVSNSIAATAPTNSVTDTTATGHGPYIYRVILDR